jgi:hypothetical protein
MSGESWNEMEDRYARIRDGMPQSAKDAIAAATAAIKRKESFHKGTDAAAWSAALVQGLVDELLRTPYADRESNPFLLGTVKRLVDELEAAVKKQPTLNSGPVNQTPKQAQ